MTGRSVEPTSGDLWEEAYLRFETPAQEVRKFSDRLRGVGASSWPRDARVLDLFSGRGNGMVALERLGFTRVRGIDLSTRLAQQGQPGRMVVGDCRHLPFVSASQDVAIVQGGLHHVPNLFDDLPQVVSEVRRVLRADGVFVVVEPWLTPFLRVVHWASNGPTARLWPKLDALATMIQHERDTYSRWLDNPSFVMAALHDGFIADRVEQRWGKLVFVGRRRPSTS